MVCCRFSVSFFLSSQLCRVPTEINCPCFDVFFKNVKKFEWKANVCCVLCTRYLMGQWMMRPPLLPFSPVWSKLRVSVCSLSSGETTSLCAGNSMAVSRVCPHALVDSCVKSLLSLSRQGCPDRVKASAYFQFFCVFFSLTELSVRYFKL